MNSKYWLFGQLLKFKIVHGLFMLDVKICRLLHIFSYLVFFIVCDSLLLDYLSQPLISSMRYKCTFNHKLCHTKFFADSLECLSSSCKR